MNQAEDARIAIADLVYTYALNIRRGTGVECVKLFTEDAVFEVRDAPLNARGAPQTRSRLTGHDAISSYLVRTSAPDARVCPLIHNLLIRVDGRWATSTSVMTSFVWPSGKQLIGDYQDCFRYETSWRFTSRVFTILGDFSYAPLQQP